jgi:hypothetical protein
MWFTSIVNAATVGIPVRGLIIGCHDAESAKRGVQGMRHRHPA